MLKRTGKSTAFCMLSFTSLESLCFPPLPPPIPTYKASPRIGGVILDIGVHTSPNTLSSPGLASLGLLGPRPWLLISGSRRSLAFKTQSHTRPIPDSGRRSSSSFLEASPAQRLAREASAHAVCRGVPASSGPLLTAKNVTRTRTPRPGGGRC